jgi:hypothetical protein
MSNISTALAIQGACSEVVFSDETMVYAARIAQKSEYDPEVINLLMRYASKLSAGVATKVIEVVMPISDFNHMMDELREVGALEGIEGEM